MTPLQQPALSKRARLWRGLVSHKPLKRHIDWWLRGLAICAVPLIIGCTVIIGAELAAPDWFSKGTGLMLATATEDLLNAAIEGSMLGCIALSRQARKDGNAKQATIMRNMGWLFAALTVITVGFRVFHASEDAGTVLLWIRCGAGIAFCYLSHLNDDDDAEEVTPHQHRTQMEQLAEAFNQQVQQLTVTFNQQIQYVTAQLAQVEQNLQQRLNESAARLEEQVQNTVRHHLAAELSAVHESLQSYQHESSSMKALLQQMERSMREEMKAEQQIELQAMKAKIEALGRGTAAWKEQAKTPVKRGGQVQAEKFDTRSFVFACLQATPDMKLSDIVQAAKLKGVELSEPTISRYRKEYRESFHQSQSESSTMEG